jgi:hypothetical protein
MPPGRSLEARTAERPTHDTPKRVSKKPRRVLVGGGVARDLGELEVPRRRRRCYRAESSFIVAAVPSLLINELPPTADADPVVGVVVGIVLYVVIVIMVVLGTERCDDPLVGVFLQQRLYHEARFDRLAVSRLNVDHLDSCGTQSGGHDDAVLVDRGQE